MTIDESTLVQIWTMPPVAAMNWLLHYAEAYPEDAENITFLMGILYRAQYDHVIERMSA